MKPVVFSQYAKIRMRIRGATEAEVELAIREGERALAKRGRLGFRKEFPFWSVLEGKILREQTSHAHSDRGA